MMQWLTRDWGPKLIALVLAVGLWFYAVGEETVEVTRVIPLEITVKNPKMSVLKTSARAVQVTIGAPRALLSDLTSEKIRVVHEIGEEVKTTGDYAFRLEPREVQLPNLQLSVKDIQPQVIQTTLDELITQKLVIKPEFFGEPAFGYTVVQKDIQLNPNAVLVEGPKGELERLDGVKTERIDLVGRVRSFRKTVSLVLPPSVKVLSESFIDVYVPLKEEFSEKIFENITVKAMTAGEGRQEIQILPPKISFTLKGSKRQLQTLVPEKVVAYIDTASLQPGEYEIPVLLMLPEDVGLKDKTALTVKAVIKKK